MPSDEGSVRLTATVHGYVQGVGFRWTTMSVAKSNGLVGFAENLASGDVLVVAEGSTVGCGALLEWLEGPSATAVRRPGRVDRVDTSWSAPEGGFRGFSVR